MPWFAIDDNADSHPKIIAAGNAAVGLWARAGAYVSRHLTDGIVPGDVAKMFGSKPQIAKLVAVGLWHPAGHDCPHPKCAQPAPGDYYMHDYLEYNQSRAQVLAKRERVAAKKRDQRARQDAARDGQPGRRAPQSAAPQDTPPPRRAQPTACLISDGWQPSDEDVQAAQLARVDAGREQLTRQQLDAVTRKFVRRMTDDGTRAAGFGGRWQQWAESERTEQQPAPGGNVVQLGMTKGQQQRAGLDRLRERMNGGTAS